MKKAIRNTIVALASMTGVFVVACSSGNNDIITGGTTQIPLYVPSETPAAAPIDEEEMPVVSPPEISQMQIPDPSETSEISENEEATETPVVTLPETLETIEKNYALSSDTVRFAGVEGEFSTIKSYYREGQPYGNYYVTLIKEKISTLSFSERCLIIDDAQFEFESVFYDPVALFITDFDVIDDYYEVLICEYGVNDWIVNTFYRYDGSTIVKLHSFIGSAYFDSHGKLVCLASYYPAIIADPYVTRSYFEYRSGRLEEVLVPIKGMTFTFAQDYASFGFYETQDTPTEEFVREVISSSPNFDSVNIGTEIYERDFAGIRFTILDYSERDVWYRGAWYFVQTDDGRKGLIHWWYAG